MQKHNAKLTPLIALSMEWIIAGILFEELAVVIPAQAGIQRQLDSKCTVRNKTRL